MHVKKQRFEIEYRFMKMTINENNFQKKLDH